MRMLIFVMPLAALVAACAATEQAMKAFNEQLTRDLVRRSEDVQSYIIEQMGEADDAE